MPVVGLSPTQKALYRPGVQVAYAVEGGQLRILSQVPGGCYAAAREYIYVLQGNTKRVQWAKRSKYCGFKTGDPGEGYGSWAEIDVNGVTVGWMQCGHLDARLADWFIGDEPALLEGLVPDEVTDAIEAVEEVANPRRGFVRRLSAAENKAIEEHAVRVVRDHLGDEHGYTTEDVGATESYDVHATKDGSALKVEVKGTTSDGAEIVLTANEVMLHLAEHPNNALAVVRRIILDRTDDGPVASGGEIELTMGWDLDRERLKPIAYRYRTGL